MMYLSLLRLYKEDKIVQQDNLESVPAERTNPDVSARFWNLRMWSHAKDLRRTTPSNTFQKWRKLHRVVRSKAIIAEMCSSRIIQVLKIYNFIPVPIRVNNNWDNPRSYKCHNLLNKIVNLCPRLAGKVHKYKPKNLMIRSWIIPSWPKLKAPIQMTKFAHQKFTLSRLQKKQNLHKCWMMIQKCNWICHQVLHRRNLHQNIINNIIAPKATELPTKEEWSTTINRNSI